jgi:hypothetical protein
MGEPYAKALAKAEAEGIALPNTVEHLKEQVRGLSAIGRDRQSKQGGPICVDADETDLPYYDMLCSRSKAL